jgi:hypothetical protein
VICRVFAAVVANAATRDQCGQSSQRHNRYATAGTHCPGKARHASAAGASFDHYHSHDYQTARSSHSNNMRSEATGNSEFLSLRPGAQSEPTEFEHVVRLQIPRTTLALWGVRLNEDNDNQKVNAEVVFGEDGIARAIRILNNAERSNQ